MDFGEKMTWFESLCFGVPIKPVPSTLTFNHKESLAAGEWEKIFKNLYWNLNKLFSFHEIIYT